MDIREMESVYNATTRLLAEWDEFPATGRMGVRAERELSEWLRSRRKEVLDIHNGLYRIIQAERAR